MRVLITGGAGFIGSFLSEALLHAGHEVFVLDNLSTGSIGNIEHLKPRSTFHYTIESVTNEPVLAEYVDRCDVIFHPAAAVGVRLIVEAPVQTIETNVHGTEVVLKHAAKKKELGTDRVDFRGLRQGHRPALSRRCGPGARPDSAAPLGVRV